MFDLTLAIPRWNSPPSACHLFPPLPKSTPIPKQEAKFPRDFGVDTLAGVLGVDPPSFGGRGRGRGGGGGGGGAAAVEEERKLVLAFLDKWKEFDWTSELDGAAR